jgi:hypothetical protein
MVVGRGVVQPTGARRRGLSDPDAPRAAMAHPMFRRGGPYTNRRWQRQESGV